MNWFWKKFLLIPDHEKLQPISPLDYSKPAKTSVTPFSSGENPYYSCKYFCDNKWYSFTRNLFVGYLAKDWERNREVIFRDFDDAVNFCKQWKTLGEIAEARKQADVEFDNALAKYNQEVAKKQKTWTSDNE